MVEKHEDSPEAQIAIPGARQTSLGSPQPPIYNTKYNKGIEDYDELLDDEPEYPDDEAEKEEEEDEIYEDEDEDLEGEGGDSGGEDEDVPEEKIEVKERVQSSTTKKRKKRKKKIIGINLSSCKYDSVKRMSKRFGMKEMNEDEDWTLLWTDCSVSLDRVMEMKKYQKVNHFPGMGEICRKDLLGRNLTRMLKLFPKEYAIFPRTWVLPADYGDFQAFCRTKKNKTYITKPESGCQGKGIAITKNPMKDIKPGEHMVCQQYLTKPFLIDGFKMDLRVYVVVTSCDPLRVFVYKDGLARFATVKYTEPTNGNVDDVFMHLTNYAINKHSSDFVRDEEKGSKRRLTTVRKWFDDNGYDSNTIWDEIYDTIIKTLISAHPILRHNYRTCFSNQTNVKGSSCFEVLGFDVMLDRKLRAWILEVNLSPSFHTDHKLDKEVKEGLLLDTMNLINLVPFDRKKCVEEERRRVKDRLLHRGKKDVKKEETIESLASIQDALIKFEDEHLGGFTRIYPREGCDKYDKYFQHSGSLFQETAASKARGECARQQREELRLKQEKLEMMLKKKPSERRDPEGVRPESPGREKSKRRSRVNVPRVALGKRLSQTNSQTMIKPLEQEFINTKEPRDILEEEELERISSLLQRDNLVRGLGVVEHVYRLLHCTPGTVGVMKNAERQANRDLQDLSGKSSRLTFSDHMAVTMPPDVNALRPNNLPYASQNPPSSFTHQITGPTSSAVRVQPHPPTHISSGQWQTMLAKNHRAPITNHQQSAYAVSQNPNPTTLQQRYRFAPRKGYATGRDARLSNTVIPEVEWKHLAHLFDPDKTAPQGGNRLITATTQGQNDWRCGDCINGINHHHHHPQERRILSANAQQRRETSTNHARHNQRGATGSNTNLTTVTMCATPPNIYIGGASSNHNFPNLIRVTQSPTSGGGAATLNLSVVSGPAPVLHRPEMGSAGSIKHSAGRVERLGSAGVSEGYLSKPQGPPIVALKLSHRPNYTSLCVPMTGVVRPSVKCQPNHKD
ncbi:tubulin polyglutamylase ttll6-like isoform X1 [Asterias rubens]|uniref:tubulin polyglutamylase ttll6-like isoform X1 n=1 Tax=Asterias rubens TaxID=7604 RepID=UPI0014553E3A|nr:tubulin polyglutamylase ttll6-like isoform X1 [Asterias rubens]